MFLNKTDKQQFYKDWLAMSNSDLEKKYNYSFSRISQYAREKGLPAKGVVRYTQAEIDFIIDFWHFPNEILAEKLKIKNDRVRQIKYKLKNMIENKDSDFQKVIK
jgi:hypothetical protein